MKNKKWIAYNSQFDANILKNSFNNENIPIPKWVDHSCCAMYQMAVPVFGSFNRYGTLSLSRALSEAGIEFNGSAHRALDDTMATIDMIHYINGLK